MLVTMGRPELIDKLLLLAGGDIGLLQWSIRAVADKSGADLEAVVYFLEQKRKAALPLLMPRELTDEQADAAIRATAVHLDIRGSQLTVNREKMKTRYRALVKFIETEQ